MKSPITKLAAAVVIIAIILLSRSTESTVWASINKAFEQVQFVHAIEWEIKSGSEKIKGSEFWVKRPNKFRNENNGYLTIDNSTEKLTINKTVKTAQLSDSQQQEFSEAKHVFACVNWLREQDPNFAKETPALTKIPEESTDQQLVYDGEYKKQPGVQRETMKFKMWVDKKTMLISRMVAYAGPDNPNIKSTLEYDFDYQEITDKMFALNIPEGYKILPPPQQTFFSGIVLDENDKPLSDVEVHIVGVEGKMAITTDADGKFTAKKRTELGARFGFPILIRAFRKNVPGEVAWNIIQDPEDKKELAYELPELNDVTVLLDPNSPPSWKCVGAAGINLKMQPAIQITGRVTDEQGIGLSGAEVKLQNIWFKHKDGSQVSGGPTWINSSAITDNQGRYLLGSLPKILKSFSPKLIASAENYMRSEEVTLVIDDTLEQKGLDFALFKGGITIKGFVKSKDGEPLPYYGLWHTVNGKKIGQVQSVHENGGIGSYVFTGKNGEFELVNCPAMNGLAVTASGAGKSPSWDFWIKNWKLDRKFEYYDEKTVSVGFEQGKNEYTVEIILEKAATKVEFEVKNPEGQPVANAEVSFGTSPYNYSDDFKTTTDETGKCVLNNLPWVKQPRLSVRKQKEPRFVPITWKILELSENIRHYKIEIILNYGDSHQQIPVEKQVIIKTLSD
jgi:outer membrane lipoprotein-sorting protein